MRSTPLIPRTSSPLSSLRHAAAVSLLLGCASAAQAQIVDGGFDINPLTTLAAVIGGPTFVYGAWGQESSTLSTGVGPVVPVSAPNMLSMTNGNNSGVFTQTAQAIDVSSGPLAALIATGTATFNYSAQFNADSGGTVGGLSMSFFSGNNFGTAIGGPISGTLAVDAVQSSWQTQAISGAIPIGTNSLLVQVFYNNASLVTTVGLLQAGFVDNARLSITSAVPEPSTWALMGAGGLLIGWRKRQLLSQAR